MRHNFRRIGEAFEIRPVEYTDSGFILSLRTDPKLSRFIGDTDASLESQQAWLTAYFDREGDYYFIIENLKTGEPEGTISVYSVDPNQKTAEWGRWILRHGSVAALESVMLLYDAAFDDIGLDSIYCRTVADNEKVIAFHSNFGLETVARLPSQFIIGGTAVDAIEQRLTASQWRAIRPKHAPMAKRLAQRIAK